MLQPLIAVALTSREFLVGWHLGDVHPIDAIRGPISCICPLALCYVQPMIKAIFGPMPLLLIVVERSRSCHSS